MKASNIAAVGLAAIIGVASAAFVGVMSAEANQCTVQCQTAAGKASGKRTALKISAPHDCIVAGRSAIKNQCKGTGTVQFGSCFGKFVNGSVKSQNVSGC